MFSLGKRCFFGGVDGSRIFCNNRPRAQKGETPKKVEFFEGFLGLVLNKKTSPVMRILPKKTKKSTDLGLSDFSEKDKKWDSHRADTQLVQRLYGENSKFERLSTRMESCSKYLDFGQRTDADTGEIGIKLAAAKFCKIRTCPVCSWRRTLKNTARFFSKMPRLLEEHPDLDFIFLTLTVKNPPMENLRETLNLMNKGWARLIELNDWPGVGFVRSTEVTNGNDDHPHPHFHAVIAVQKSYWNGKNYISKERWRDLWKKSMRLEYDPIIDVKKVREKQGKGINGALLEVLKYSIKPGDLFEADFLYGVTKQLYKLRFFATGGIFKNWLKDEKLNDDDMIHVDEDGESTDKSKPDSLIRFTWRSSDLRYRKLKNII